MGSGVDPGSTHPKASTKSTEVAPGRRAGHSSYDVGGPVLDLVPSPPDDLETQLDQGSLSVTLRHDTPCCRQGGRPVGAGVDLEVLAVPISLGDRGRTYPHAVDTGHEQAELVEHFDLRRGQLETEIVQGDERERLEPGFSSRVDQGQRGDGAWPAEPAALQASRSLTSSTDVQPVRIAPSAMATETAARWLRRQSATVRADVKEDSPFTGSTSLGIESLWWSTTPARRRDRGRTATAVRWTAASG